MDCSLLAQLRGDERGNFSIFAAVAMVPLVLAGGVALDFSMISNRHSELQNSLDAAALAVAREGDAITDAQAIAIAQDFVKANFHIPYGGLKVIRTGTRVTVEASTLQKLQFGGVLGYDHWPVSAASSADIAFNHYEIALVLDTTGSMAGGKLTAMKDAVLGLIDTMSSQVDDPEKLKFAVVPFANFVNVGSHFGPEFDKKGKMKKGTGAEWLDLEGKVNFPQLELKKGVSRFEVFHNLGEGWGGCVETRYSGGKNAKAYDVADIEPSKKDKRSLFVPAFAIDEPDKGYGNSYMISDADPLDKSSEGEIKKLKKYGIDPATLGLGGGDDDDDDDDENDDDNEGGGIDGYGAEATPLPVDRSGGKGPNKDCVTQPIQPLTKDYEKIKTMVKSLQANGNTNIMEGVAWGMRALSPKPPFSEGSEKAPGMEKIMIVLTDGSNVFGNNWTRLGSSYSSNGYLVDGRLGISAGSSKATNSLMNEKTLAACENAKQAGTVVYTIRLEEPDVKTGMMLKECATSPAHFFDAPSRRQLDEVFKSIRDDVVRLRISS